MSYLRIKLKHHRSAADDKLLQRQMQTRQEQLRAAVQYCNDEGCKGYAAEKSHRSHGKYWVLKDNHVDSRPTSDLTKVEPLVNWEGHFVFN